MGLILLAFGAIAFQENTKPSNAVAPKMANKTEIASTGLSTK